MCPVVLLFSNTLYDKGNAKLACAVITIAEKTGV